MVLIDAVFEYYEIAMWWGWLETPSLVWI